MESTDLEMHQRPLVFGKMEALVREMQDPETGVPVRSQKLFLTSIPSAFMGYDLIEWLMERLNIEDSAEAVHLANILCQSGYFFPVGDTKSLSVKDDSSLYRFQTPYYWPSQSHCPDNVEYAIYLAKRSLRNKQKHGLEDYEVDALSTLKLSLQHKWDFVTMQAEEQVRLAKERKKGEKLVRDSQERAHWRVARPPPSEVQHPDAPAAQPPHPPAPPAPPHPPSSRSPSTPHRLVHDPPHSNLSHRVQMEGGIGVIAGPPHSVPMAIASPPLPPWAAAICGVGAMGGRLPSSFDTGEDLRMEGRRGGRQRRRRQTEEELRKEVAFLQVSLSRIRMKASQALESLAARGETYAEYDPFLNQPQPSNPWLSDDVQYWNYNAPVVEVPTEKRVRRWALSMEDLVSDPTGLQEFTWYLCKEYSHENIRFWQAVRDLRRSAQCEVQDKIRNIYQEFLVPGAPCEINIDGQTMERVQACLGQFSKEEKAAEGEDDISPSEASSVSRYSSIGGLSPRFAFDAAAEHVYALLLQKDCYPRFIRSPHYKALLANGIQPSTKKRFFNFGGPNKKKTSSGSGSQTGNVGMTGKKKGGDDRSLSGSIHDLAANAVRPNIGQRITPGAEQAPWESSTTALASKDSDICPWDTIPSPREQPEGQEESVVVEVEVEAEPKIEPKADVVVVMKSKGEEEGKIKGEEKKSEEKEDIEVVKKEEKSEEKTVDQEMKEKDNEKEKKKIPKEEDNETNITVKKDEIKEDNKQSETPKSNVEEQDGKGEKSQVSDSSKGDKAAEKKGEEVKNEKTIEVGKEDEEKRKQRKKSEAVEKTVVVVGAGEEGKGTGGGEEEGREKGEKAVGEESKEGAGGESVEGVEKESGVERKKEDRKKSKADERKSREERARRREERREERREGGTKEKYMGKGEPGMELVTADAANQERLQNQPGDTTEQAGGEGGVGNVVGSSDRNEDRGRERRKEGKRRHRRKGGGGEGDGVNAGTTGVAVTTAEWQQDRRQSEENDVCPWEDEDTCKVDAPFVKTYATLGYL